MNVEIGSVALQFLFWEYLFALCNFQGTSVWEMEDINFHSSHYSSLQTYSSTTKIMTTSKHLRTCIWKAAVQASSKKLTPYTSVSCAQWRLGRQWEKGSTQRDGMGLTRVMARSDSRNWRWRRLFEYKYYVVCTSSWNCQMRRSCNSRRYGPSIQASIKIQLI